MRKVIFALLVAALAFAAAGTGGASTKAPASSASALALVGPAGSNEVKATTPTIKNAGLGFVSGSATNTTLTTDGTRTGFFFRTVPPDAVQGAAVAKFIATTKKYKRVYIIDDQEAYSTGLADFVQAKLRAAGVTVGRDGVSQQQSDFSALIAKIARNTQLVYLPWQVADKAKAFADQMRSAGKGGITLMGSDGLFDPAFAAVKGAYDSFFPVNAKDKTVLAYQRSHGGNGEYFGAPSYVAAQVIGRAVDRACKNGTASRAEVRTQIRRTRMGVSLLGIPVRFKANGDIRGGTFGIYQSNGTEFKPI